MKARPLLGLATMFAVQIMFGVASELSSSTALVFAIPVAGGFTAAACGGFVARRGFALPAVGLLFADFALVAYALAHLVAEPIKYGNLSTRTWVLLASAAATMLAAVWSGAIFGMRAYMKRAVQSASSAT